MKNLRNGLMKARYFIFAAMLFLTNFNVAFAAAYGENAAKWITGQLGWVALAAVAIALLLCIAKRNLVGAITSGIGGAVLVYLIFNPEKIKTIGETIASIIFK